MINSAEFSNLPNKRGQTRIADYMEERLAKANKLSTQGLVNFWRRYWGAQFLLFIVKNVVLYLYGRRFASAFTY